MYMMSTSEYTYLQENGQMKYGGPPPNWIGPPPGKGTEIFVSSLPRDASLSEICPVFANIGEIYAARLMMDFSGTNRGFCFIQYRTKEEARSAILELNNYEIRPDHRIHVSISLDNCRLFIGQVPKELRKEEIKEMLESVTTGVKEVILYLSPIDKSMNRGFCFVEYQDHRSAAMARRSLISTGIPAWGREVRIDWAIPEEEVDEAIMRQVTVVYIRNLMLRTSEVSLKDVICRVVSPSDVTRVRKVKDFAFIHFQTREAAEKAISYLNGFNLDGAHIIATWAKPNPPGEDIWPSVKNVKREKDRRKLDLKKNNDSMKILSKSVASQFKNNGGKPVLSIPGNPQLYVSAMPPAAVVSPALHYSSDNINMVLPPYGYQPASSSVNTLSVVPFVCPPIGPLKEGTYKTLVDTYLNAYIPAVALRYIILRLGWGEVYFNINFELDHNSCALFNAQVLIVKQDKTVQYPPVYHPPAYSPYDAKNMAALFFIKSYILCNQNPSKIFSYD